MFMPDDGSCARGWGKISVWIIGITTDVHSSRLNAASGMGPAVCVERNLFLYHEKEEEHEENEAE